MKGLLIVYLLFVCYSHVCESQQQSGLCPTRDQDAANAVGRGKCRKPCFRLGQDRRCKNRKICTCDHECGLSCINENNECEALPRIENMARIVVRKKDDDNEYVHEATEPYRYDDKAMYECDPGYTLVPDGVVHLCHGRRNWTHFDVSQCALACSPLNEREVLENNMRCGPSCATDRQCSVGMKCRCDGPCGRTCVRLDVDCGPAPNASNSVIRYTGAGFDKVAHFRCLQGYFVRSGSVVRRCTAGGTWDGQRLICGRVTCGDPQPAIEAMSGEMLDWRPRYYVGQNVTMRCMFGRRLLGSSVRTCQSNGRWSGVETACDAIDEFAAEEGCPHPGVPINGKLLRHRGFGVGSVVEFQCNRGYAMIGERRQECLYFLQWDGDGAPLCVDPRFRDTDISALEKLTESTRHIKATLPNVGRTVDNTFAGGHEIYFVIDLSGSIRSSDLKSLLGFCKKLILRLSANATGDIDYGVIVFATNSSVRVDIKEKKSAESVINDLNSIEKERENIKKDIRIGTNTDRALQLLRDQVEFSYAKDKKISGGELRRQRHVFILTDGGHNEGADPQNILQEMIQRTENPPTFYSVSTCKNCNLKGSKAYEELMGLALGKTENFIYIDDFYNLEQALNKATYARYDYSQCGQAGDIESLKQRAKVGRVIGGTNAAIRSWPWQVYISKYSKDIKKTYDEKNAIGGGSVINNQWILTAAHLFYENDEFLGDVPEKYVVTYGVHKLPTNGILLPITRVYRAARIITHENFDPHSFNNDIALVKIGNRQVQQNKFGTRWENSIEGHGRVSYSDYIRPVCLPCVENNFLENYVKLNKNETFNESCRTQGEFLFQTNKDK
ncbi:complement factor B-like [Clavelina lepadiformis]|uniref:complement factor B-like n=1 Tax=Clavelina lepadiformis TaxID=159417 RepID=UPI004041E705